MDIRNFFGGKKEEKKRKEEKKKRKEEKKKKEEESVEVVELLEDSDEDEAEAAAGGERKRRLQKKKETPEKKQKKSSSSSSSSSSKEERRKAPAAVTVIEEEKTPPAAKKEEKRAKKSEVKETVKRAEIKGGASAFFGSSSSSSSPSSTVGGSGKKRSATEVYQALEEKQEEVAATPSKRPQRKAKTPPSSSSKKQNKKEKVQEEEHDDNQQGPPTLLPLPPLSVEILKSFVSSDLACHRYSLKELQERAADVTSNSTCVKASQCLGNLRVAFSGVMERFISREKLEDLFLSHGAKVAKAVSGTTHFLVAADESLEDGRPVSSGRKHMNATEKSITILSEKQALVLLLFGIDTATATSTEMQHGNSSTTATRGGAGMSTARSKAITSAYEVGGTTHSVAAMKRAKTEPATSSSSSSVPVDKTAVAVEDNLLWVDKYKPSRLEEVIGGTDNIKKLVDWLKRWDNVHVKKAQKVAYTKENPGAKAVLISGPPGIGKTTLATLIATTMGYEVLELNASDARSKRAIEDQVKDVVMSRALSMTGQVKKRLVIMDEVDGMGGSDRGGIPELIKVIKSALNPIICLCNDRQAMKIKSLANHCFDIRLRRPTKASVAQRLVQIGRQESLSIELNAAELLVEQMGNDIRQCINAAQMWKAQSNVMRYSDLRAPLPVAYSAGSDSSGQKKAPTTTEGGRMRSIEKDKILRQSPFDACGMILGGGKQDFNERYNSFFIDYSLLPLLVQQNYIESSMNGISRLPGKDDSDKLDMLSRAADSVSEMELLGAQVRGNDQHWELLPAQAALSLRVGSVVQGYQSFPTFPQWLGKNSTTNKNKRLTQELVVHTLQKAGQGFESIRMEYSFYIKFIMTRILKQYGTSNVPAGEDGVVRSGVQEVVRLLDSYGLSRDDLMDTMQALPFTHSKDPHLQDHFAFLDSKLKAAFTREYNSCTHGSQALVEPLTVKKKRRATAAVDDDDEEGTNEDLGASKEVEDGDSDAELEAFLKKHAKGKGGKGGKKAGAPKKKKKK